MPTPEKAASSFEERLAALRPTPPGTPCATCRLLANMEPRAAAALRAVIDAPRGTPGRLSGVVIAKFLQDEGYEEATEHSIDNHRRVGHA